MAKPKSKKSARKSAPAAKHVRRPAVGATLAAPEPVVPARQAPRYSSDGVLLNPEACHVGSDGVVTSK